MFFWGFLAIALKIAVRKVDAFTIVWMRFTIAFIALSGYMIFTDRKQFQIFLKPPAKLVIAALALAINYIGFMLGIHYTSPSNAQVIIQIGPIILAIAGVVLFKEKIRKRQLIGFAVVLIGFSLFYSQQLKNMFINPQDFNKGVLLTIMGALAWVTYAIMQKYLVRSYPPLTLNLFLFGLPALLYLPLVDFQNLATLDYKWWLLLLFLGANTLIAYGGMTAALKYLDANKVSTVIINNPIITFLTMGLLTYLEVSWISPEHFPPLVWLGAFMFIAGAFVVIRSGKK